MAAASVSVWAEGAWLLVTDNGERVEMSRVGMLVAADDATSFSVVKAGDAGEVIPGVTSVTFVYDAAWSGVDKIEKGQCGFVIDGVSATILVMGCEGREYNVYDIAGNLQFSGVVNGASSRIDVSGLNNGVYVLKVGDSSVKFKK